MYQQASNTFKDYNGDGKKDGKPYGKKGDEWWQQIALSESWANYRENLLLNRCLVKNYSIQWIIYFFQYYGFPIYYGALFAELEQFGCSYSDMEKAISTYSFIGYHDNLIREYPNLKDSITAKVNRYESKNF